MIPSESQIDDSILTLNESIKIGNKFLWEKLQRVTSIHGKASTDKRGKVNYLIFGQQHNREKPTFTDTGNTK